MSFGGRIFNSSKPYSLKMEDEGVDWLLELLQQVPLTMFCLSDLQSWPMSISGSAGTVLCPDQGWAASVKNAAFWVCPIGRLGEGGNEQASGQEVVGHHQEKKVEEQADQVLAHCGQVWHLEKVGSCHFDLYKTKWFRSVTGGAEGNNGGLHATSQAAGAALLTCLIQVQNCFVCVTWLENGIINLLGLIH